METSTENRGTRRRISLDGRFHLIARYPGFACWTYSRNIGCIEGVHLQKCANQYRLVFMSLPVHYFFWHDKGETVTP